ncbi:MAG TPA: hypothetical protein VE133_05300 [Candidatus Sulfotelmatobacter sp.]|nr:hypothetical protein [Candidatus Sulfotelmatobacter sp.]
MNGSDFTGIADEGDACTGAARRLVWKGTSGGEESRCGEWAAWERGRATGIAALAGKAGVATTLSIAGAEWRKNNDVCAVSAETAWVGAVAFVPDVSGTCSVRELFSMVTVAAE